jgi:peptide/nickel transport system substrate-binding protein/oligopeptide transport system substrate-binding protein
VSFYTNPAFDTLVSRARRELNDTTRAKMYMTADAMAFHDAPMLFLFFYKDVDAVQPWVRGFTVPPIFNGQRWNTVSIVRDSSVRDSSHAAR